MKKLFTSLLIILIFVGLFFYFSLIEHETYSAIEDNFDINKSYLSVVKSLANKESLEKTLEENDAKLQHKQWQNFTVEVPKRILKIREYKLDGKLDFLIEKNDDSLGKLNLPFEQNIIINKDVFNINTQLKSPQKNVLLCNKVITIIPAEEIVKVNIKSELKVKKTIPYFFKDFMDNKVKESNKNSFLKLKNNLINATEGSSPVVKFKKGF